MPWRKYKSTEIGEELLSKILYSGTRASTSGNMQVYSIIVTTDQNINLQCTDSVEIDVDAKLLHRAIENIVRNARYYSPPDGEILINCHLKSDQVCISIEDEGPGVPEDMLENIFQPFVRVSSARESDTGGSGIGLAIAKRVIDSHGGTIRSEERRCRERV